MYHVCVCSVFAVKSFDSYTEQVKRRAFVFLTTNCFTSLQRFPGIKIYRSDSKENPQSRVYRSI